MSVSKNNILILATLVFLTSCGLKKSFDYWEYSQSGNVRLDFERSIQMDYSRGKLAYSLNGYYEEYFVSYDDSLQKNPFEVQERIYRDRRTLLELDWQLKRDYIQVNQFGKSFIIPLRSGTKEQVWAIPFYYYHDRDRSYKFSVYQDIDSGRAKVWAINKGIEQVFSFCQNDSVPLLRIDFELEGTDYDYLNPLTLYLDTTDYLPRMFHFLNLFPSNQDKTGYDVAPIVVELIDR